MKKILFAALLYGAIAGCSDTDGSASREPCLRILDVHLGMNIADVEARLGLKTAEEPTGTRAWEQVIRGNWGELSNPRTE